MMQSFPRPQFPQALTGRVAAAIAAGFVVMMSAVVPVDAQAVTERFTSAYTPVDLDQCKLIKRFEEGGGGSWRCPGYRGINVTVSEGDLRFYVGYGPNAATQKAMRQTLPRFNTLHKVMEWRLERRGGDEIPIATILRYFWDVDGEKGQVLVVTKLEGNEACHIAYITADGNPDANVQAREIVDNDARAFDCDKDEPQSIGGAAGRTSPR